MNYFSTEISTAVEKYALPAESGEKGCLIIALSDRDFKGFLDGRGKYF
jgi:hypothetical protein